MREYNQVEDLHTFAAGSSDLLCKFASSQRLAYHWREAAHFIIAEAELCTPTAWWYAKAEPLMIYKTYADALGLDKKISRLSNGIFFGAGDRGRTDTMLPSRDFEFLGWKSYKFIAVNSSLFLPINPAKQVKTRHIVSIAVYTCRKFFGKNPGIFPENFRSQEQMIVKLLLTISIDYLSWSLLLRPLLRIRIVLSSTSHAHKRFSASQVAFLINTYYRISCCSFPFDYQLLL